MEALRSLPCALSVEERRVEDFWFWVCLKDMAGGQKWLSKMEQWEMEPRTKTCGPLVLYF